MALSPVGAYATKTTFMQDMIDSMGGGRRQTQRIAANLRLTTVNNWDATAGTYLSSGNIVTASATPPTGGNLPDTTHWPAFTTFNLGAGASEKTDLVAAVAAAANDGQSLGLTDILLRMSGSDTTAW